MIDLEELACRVEGLVERLRARSFRLATRDMNGDGAKLALEAATLIESQSSQLSELRKAADGMAEDAAFLIARIDELEWMDDGYDNLVRDWFGHVEPALARFRTALSQYRGES